MRFVSAFVWSVGLALPVSALAAACSTSSGAGATPCVAGQQSACACEDGATGAQVCRSDGTGYGPCQPCGTQPSPDASADGRAGDASRSDGSPGPSPDAMTGDGPGGCVYPTDHLDDSPPPQPTDGTCQGNTAMTCDPLMHTLVGHACAAGEVCATYAVTEHPDGTTEPGPGRTYQWAGCIPAGAAPCSFSWMPSAPNSIPPGTWVSSPAGQCQGNDAVSCQMAPIIGDAAYLDSWAGTSTGTLATASCASNEACADDPTFPGHPDCYAAPLVACAPVASSGCTGDVLLDCSGHPYQKRVDCSAQGQTCREDCSLAAGFDYQAAECRPPVAAAASPCNPATYPSSCSDPATLEDCQLLAPSPTSAQPAGGGITPDCFLSAGQCVCYPTTHPCSAVGCGEGSTNCQCATVTSTGPECIDATETLCDPATTPDSCNGATAQLCIGFIQTVDCSLLGETCAVAAGHAGCVAAPATPCGDAGLPTACSGNTLTGCCPASGQFTTDAGEIQLPCAPGFGVSLDCSKLDLASGGLSCKTSMGPASCM